MKFEVTPELATLLKTLRNRNGITSRDVAAKIGRSPSYLSKLEHRDIRSIQKDELTQILSFITEGEDFYQDKLPNILKVLSTMISPEGLFQQTWFLQYDMADRPVTVPASLQNELQSFLGPDITAEELTEIANANRDIEDSPSIPNNEVVFVGGKHFHLLRVRFHFQPGEIARILYEPGTTSHYIYVYGIAYLLIKLKRFGDIGRMEPKDAASVLDDTEALLERHQFYSLTQFGRFLSSTEFQNTQLDELRQFRAVNTKKAGKISDVFEEMAEYDQSGVSHSLDTLRKNLDWDPAFTMKMLSLPFYDLGRMSYSKKKELLEKIETLLRETQDLPNMVKLMEQY